MGSFGHRDFPQWKIVICPVLLLVILLVVESKASPVSNHQKTQWQQLDTQHGTSHNLVKRATRSDKLQRLRTVLNLKQGGHSIQQPYWSIGEITRLLNILKSGNAELPPLTPTADSTLQQGAMAAQLGSPYASDSSYASSAEDGTSFSSSELPSSFLDKLAVKRSYRTRSRPRSRYSSIKRVLPCYWNVVTCF